MALRGNAMPSAIAAGLRRQQMGEAGGFGSIAYRNMPTYGSILSRRYPGVFGQTSDGNAPNIAKDTALIDSNHRQLTLRRQAFEFQHPEQYQQNYDRQQQNYAQQQQAYAQRQNKLLPSISPVTAANPLLPTGLDDDEEDPRAP